MRDRRALYLGRIRGEVGEAQKVLIDTLIETEWNALRCEAEGGITAYRDGRENRRLLMRLLADFERSLVAVPRKQTTAEILAEIHSPPKAA